MSKEEKTSAHFFHWSSSKAHIKSFFKNLALPKILKRESKEERPSAQFFHWPSSNSRIESFLRILALPIGCKGQMSYDQKWVNKDFLANIIKFNGDKSSQAIFWVLSCKQEKSADQKITSFEFACPIRYLTKINASESDGQIIVNFIAHDYINPISKIESLDTLESFSRLPFSKHEVPSPGQEGGFVFISPKVSKETTKSIILETIHNQLISMSYPIERIDKTQLLNYPFIKIKENSNWVPNSQGLLKIKANKKYSLDVSIFQTDEHRDRSIYIYGEEFVGKVVTKNISIEDLGLKKQKLDLKVEFVNTRFYIPLGIKVKKPWYLKKMTALTVIGIICAGSFFAFKQFKGTASSEDALLFALIVVFIERLWDSFTKQE